ncbi:MAG: hypothetical protein CFH06_00785 [Alphaproteobacteria bacterium MarineAlpha3_Bin5]|nr:hypothetical protein [Magnetovibrio sp.]PPR78495.1 MAG: hypothetical protein CFH06_00785 [Alphaproteobacteria bacterium MarineAlpha3_Bin5]
MTARASDINAVSHQTAEPKINKVHPRDLISVLVKGLNDFEAMPTHVLFLCLIYPIVIGFGARVFAGYEILPLLFPLLTGYTIIGPLVATGMYELSRRREKGLDTSRKKAFHVLQRHATRSIGVLGLFLTVIYLVWLTIAMDIWQNIFKDYTPKSLAEFASVIFATPEGWNLIVVGSTIGSLFAITVFCFSVISFPMLMDRDIKIRKAVSTSIKAVLNNPITMTLWGFIVVCGLFIGALPLFVGLCVILPVLGHSTWHLYRKVVVYD